MTPEVRQRIVPAAGEPAELSTPDAKVVTSLWDQFVEHDYNLSYYFALMCRLDKNTWTYFFLHIFTKACEIFGSGVPTLTFTILAMLFCDCTSMCALLFNISVAHLVDIAGQFLIKGIVKRARPNYNSGPMFFCHGVDNYSFPSGHCSRMAMFCYLTCILLDVNDYFAEQYVAVLIYIIIGLSRVFMGRHYCSDLVGGILLGVAEGWFCWHYLWVVPDNLYYLNVCKSRFNMNLF